ncbi:MAG TPA: YncE family protein [Pseudomonadales bacterium]|nr:YncE family protein [Pseudomonadales bacterium]
MKRSILLLLVLLASITVQASTPNYHVIRKIHLGGDGFWDYLAVSDSTRQLFVSHATHVTVLDLASGRVVGDIADTPGVHGIAFAPKLGRGFISCGRTDVVKIFDLKTLKVIGEVKTGKDPDSVMFDPATGHVFAMNGHSDSATVIDAANGKVVGTIALGGKPEEARTDGDGIVWINLEDKSEVVKVDSRKLTVLARYPLAPGEEPSGMTLVGHYVISVCHNKLMTILDAASGKVIETLRIGGYVDGAGYDPATGMVFSSNGIGTLTIARQESPGKFAVVQTVETEPGARTMTIDPKTHDVYLSTGKLIMPKEKGGRYGVVKDSFGLLEVGP